MALISTEVVIVGAGQAGIATSEHLTAKGIKNIVLERDEIASRWRKERWDSLVANGPAWHDRFPGLKFSGDPERFATKDEVADYFVEYVRKFDLNVVEGVNVSKVTRKEHERGFYVQTSGDTYECDFVVAATGAFQIPVVPEVVADSEGFHQIHSSEYRRPSDLPGGGVLVVGAGSSGVQIAEELCDSGRSVYLSVGPHDRPPRRYRNRDFVYWLGVLGKWDKVTPEAGAEHVTIAVSGAKGGNTVDFRALAAKGITLLGRAGAYMNGKMSFAPDLAKNIHAGDQNYLSLLREADAFINANGLDLPEEPEAYVLGPDPECVVHPLETLALKECGITSIVWATGFGRDYSWLEVPGSLDGDGNPRQMRGVSDAQGVYFVGLPWQSRRGSSFIWGSWHDAKFVADEIEIQRNYRDFISAVDPISLEV